MILERKTNDVKGTSFFLKYAKNITSQHGEDGIIEAIFDTIIPETTSRPNVCVEVGAWDGQHLSNTFNLLHNRGWGGCLIEADEIRSMSCRELYKGRTDVHCVCSFVGIETLPQLLNDYQVPQDFEFLSIDIDGADYHVWKSLHGRFSPKLVVIEFNPTIPNRVLFVQDADTRIQQGSSLLALTELGAEMGYTLVATTSFNAFFLLNELSHLLPPSCTFDIDALHPCAMSTEMFQTYDGEIKFVGPLKLLWHRLAINPQKMQVLSKRSRIFPFAPPWVAKIEDMEGALFNLGKMVQAQGTCEEGEIVGSDGADMSVVCAGLSIGAACVDLMALLSLEGFAVEAATVMLHLMASHFRISSSSSSLSSSSSSSSSPPSMEGLPAVRAALSDALVRGAEAAAASDASRALDLLKLALHTLFFSLDDQLGSREGPREGSGGGSRGEEEEAGPDKGPKASGTTPMCARCGRELHHGTQQGLPANAVDVPRACKIAVRIARHALAHDNLIEAKFWTSIPSLLRLVGGHPIRWVPSPDSAPHASKTQSEGAKAEEEVEEGVRVWAALAHERSRLHAKMEALAAEWCTRGRRVVEGQQAAAAAAVAVAPCGSGVEGALAHLGADSGPWLTRGDAIEGSGAKVGVGALGGGGGAIAGGDKGVARARCKREDKGKRGSGRGTKKEGSEVVGGVAVVASAADGVVTVGSTGEGEGERKGNSEGEGTFAEVGAGRDRNGAWECELRHSCYKAFASGLALGCVATLVGVVAFKHLNSR